MIITKTVEEQIEAVFQKGKLSIDEWNEIQPYLKDRTIDMSEPLPFQTCYIGSNAFHCVLMFNRHFYHITGSMYSGVMVKCVDKIGIHKIYFE